MFLTHTKQQLKVYTSVYTVNLLPRDVINHHVIYHTTGTWVGPFMHLVVLRLILFTGWTEMSTEIKVRYYANTVGEGGKGVRKEEVLTLRVSNSIHRAIV